MPEVTNLHPNDATDSSSFSEEETTWPTAEHPPRRESNRPQIPESQQAADEFTTSSSESSLEEYQFSGTPRLRRRARSSIRAEEDLQQDDESIGIDIHLTNEVNLSVVTDAASMTSEGGVIWIRRHEPSGSDSDSERSNTPEMLENADSDKAVVFQPTSQESWINKVSMDCIFYIGRQLVYLQFKYPWLVAVGRDYRGMFTEYQNIIGKGFIFQHEAICLTISSG